MSDGPKFGKCRLAKRKENQKKLEMHCNEKKSERRLICEYDSNCIISKASSNMMPNNRPKRVIRKPTYLNNYA